MRSGRWALHLSVAVVAVAAMTLALTPAVADPIPDTDEYPDVAFLARNDVPFDAQTAASVAAQLGAPMLITTPNALSDAAADGIADLNPDVLIVAGGSAAISEAVADEAAQQCDPDCEIDRRFGTGRDETAVALAGIAAEYGFDRPVLQGSDQVVGDVHVGGTVHTDTLTVQDPGLVTGLNTDRIDGLHAGDLGSLDSYRDLDLEEGTTHANSSADGNPYEEIVTRTIQVPVDGFLLVTSSIFMSEDDGTSQTLVSVTRLDWDPDVPVADQRDRLIGLDLHSPGGSEEGVGTSFTTAGGIAVSAGTHTVTLQTQGADADTPYTTAGPRLTTLFVPFGTETVVDTSGS